MISILLSAAVVIGGISGDPQLAASESPPKISCKYGPTEHRFGGASWLVFGCSDDRSMAVVSTPGGLDGSFYFIVKPDSGTTNVMGEGTGDTRVTSAARAELEKLSPDDVRRLIIEAKEEASKH